MFYLFAIIAASLAVAMEFLWRRGVSWYDYVVPFALAAVGLNYLLFRLLSGPHSWLSTILVFTLSTNTLRILLSHFGAHEPLVKGNLVAAVALLAAIIVGRIWR